MELFSSVKAHPADLSYTYVALQWLGIDEHGLLQLQPAEVHNLLTFIRAPSDLPDQMAHRVWLKQAHMPALFNPHFFLHDESTITDVLAAIHPSLDSDVHAYLIATHRWPRTIDELIRLHKTQQTDSLLQSLDKVVYHPLSRGPTRLQVFILRSRLSDALDILVKLSEQPASEDAELDWPMPTYRAVVPCIAECGQACLVDAAPIIGLGIF